MIIKNYEIKNYIDNNNFFLIYGQNQGLKEEIIINFSAKYLRESVFKYNEKEILSDSENFYNNILSQSFFDKEKLILIENISDKFLSEIKNILEKKNNSYLDDRKRKFRNILCNKQEGKIFRKFFI